MGSDGPGAGRLIALEGASGPDLSRAAASVLRRALKGKERGGVSTWDASGIFWELRRAPRDLPQLSARTLTLLYAADLVFRLRWDIQPALDQGMVVVAAPYVESAVAFGKAAGLSRRWLLDLFSFAPKPRLCYRLREKKTIPGWKFKRSQGYLEFCCKTLLADNPAWSAEELRRRFLEYLDTLEDRKACRAVNGRILEK